ncbi:MAG: MBL fold metallo-hydrolase [Bacteroidota bacterium]
MLNIETFTFFPEAFAENTYVVWDESHQCVVIDPGCYHQHERQKLVAFLENNGLTLEKVLNTHCHIDHIFGNRLLVEKYKVPLIAHKEDVYNIAGAETAAQLWNLHLDPSPEPTDFVDEGDTVSFGNTTFQVLFTPGHSAGHISFYHPESNSLFSGDVIFRGSYGRVDLPGGSMEVLRKTIKEKILTLPDATQIYAGHLGPTSVATEKKMNPILWEE